MVIVASVLFPPESAKEIGERFLRIPPVPGFMALRGPYIKGKKEDGIHALEIYELENTQLAEGLKYVTNRCAAYFGVPDFKYEINVYFEAVEAVKLIGLD